METEKNIRLGMSPEEARLKALRSFGPMEKHKEETRDARGVSWIETLVADLRYGARALLKHPGYALLAVLTLGLGIGANTAIFSVINGVLLKPLPYEHGDRLVVLQQSRPLSGQPQVGVAIAEYFDYRERGKDVFDGLVEYHQMNFDLINRGEPDRVNTGVVSANFFELLGIKPILGRNFVAADDVRGAEAVLILSHTYWRQKFGGDPNIVGQVFEMNDRPHRVIGVLPNVPHYPQENDVYMPVLACPFRARGETQIAQNRRAFGALNVFGRLKQGASAEQAASAVGAICHTFTEDNKQVYRPETSGFRATTVPVRDALTSGARDLLLILLGITGLVLLIACANVANLTLARMLGRDRELAMRAALGAGRGRLVRQLLTESTLLATVGGAIGDRLRLDHDRHADDVRRAVHVAHRRDRARSDGAGLHAWRVDPDRRPVRHAAGARQPRRSRRGAEAGRRPGRRRRQPQADSGRADRGAGGRLGDAAGRRRPVARQLLPPAARRDRLSIGRRAVRAGLRQLLPVSHDRRTARSCICRCSSASSRSLA